MNYKTIRLPLFGRSRCGRLLSCDLTIVADPLLYSTPPVSTNSSSNVSMSYSDNLSLLSSPLSTPLISHTSVSPTPITNPTPIVNPVPSPFFGLPVQHPVNSSSSLLPPSNQISAPFTNLMAKPFTSGSFSFCNSSSLKTVSSTTTSNNNNNREMTINRRMDSIIPIEMLNKMPKVTEACLQKRLNMCHNRLVGNPCKSGLSLYSMLHKGEIKKLLNGEKRNRNGMTMLYEQCFNSLSPTIRNEYEEVNKFLKELYSIETSQRQINQYEKSFGCAIELFYKKHYFESLNQLKRVYCNNLTMQEIEYIIDTIYRLIRNERSVKIDFNKVKIECEKEFDLHLETIDYHNMWRYLAYGLENKCEEEKDVDSDDEMINGRLSIRNEHRYLNHPNNRKMKYVKAFSESNKVKEIPNTLKSFVCEEENDINNEILRIQNEMKNTYNNNNKELNPEDIINNIILREKEMNNGLKIESNEILNKMSIDGLVFLKDICYVNNIIMNSDNSNSSTTNQ